MEGFNEHFPVVKAIINPKGIHIACDSPSKLVFIGPDGKTISETSLAAGGNLQKDIDFGPCTVEARKDNDRLINRAEWNGKSELRRQFEAMPDIDRLEMAADDLLRENFHFAGYAPLHSLYTMGMAVTREQFLSAFQGIDKEKESKAAKFLGIDPETLYVGEEAKDPNFLGVELDRDDQPLPDYMEGPQDLILNDIFELENPELVAAIIKGCTAVDPMRTPTTKNLVLGFAHDWVRSAYALRKDGIDLDVDDKNKLTVHALYRSLNSL